MNGEGVESDAHDPTLSEGDENLEALRKQALGELQQGLNFNIRQNKFEASIMKHFGFVETKEILLGYLAQNKYFFDGNNLGKYDPRVYNV